MKSSDLDSKGLNMMYKSTETPIIDTAVAANFANTTANETFIREGTRNVIHMMGPLNFDIGGSNSYLLDNVSIHSFGTHKTKPRFISC